MSQKKQIIIGTAGHVDHGKTSLIRALTQVDCDTHKQEKERGITINLGFTHVQLPSGMTAGIIDMPGHKDFIQTVVAGAHGIDMALLLVAADSGIMPQTQEHLKLLELLHINHCIVVVNKIDLVDEEMLELVKMEVEEKISESHLKEAPIVFVSALQEKGMDKLIEEIDLMAQNMPEKTIEPYFRLYVDRIFNVKGIGYVVTGSAINGKVQVGDYLYLQPGKEEKYKVKSIQEYGKEVAEAEKGARVALNLSNLNKEELKMGMMLTNRIWEPTEMIDVQLKNYSPKPLAKNFQVIFLSGTYESEVRGKLLDTNELNENKEGFAQLYFSEQVVFLPGDRFVIRNSSKANTIGGGVVLDTKPLHHRKRSERLIEQLQVLQKVVHLQENLYQKILWSIDKFQKPAFAESFLENSFNTLEQIIQSIDEQEEKKLVYYPVGKSFLISSLDLNYRFEEEIVEIVENYHKENPLLENGLSIEEMTGKFPYSREKWAKEFTQILLEELKNSGKLLLTNNTYSLAAHEVVMDKKTNEQKEVIEEFLRNFGMNKPTFEKITDFALSKNINKEKLKAILQLLSKEKKVYVSGSDVLHYNIIDKCRKLLIPELQQRERGINEKDFRLLLDGSKKLVQVLIKIFEEENTIEKKGFYIYLKT